MKNGVLILMALVIVASGYVLKMKSDESATLTADLRKKDETLSLIQERLKNLDNKLAKDEERLAAEQSQLAGQAQQAQLQSNRLAQDLAAAQKSLAQEIARKQELRDQESALGSAKPSVADVTLTGAMQNDQTRLKEVERQLKVIKASEKNRKLTNKGDAKIYHDQMTAQEKSLQLQVKNARAQVKALQNQLKAKQKEKLNLNRDQEATALQRTIDGVTTSIAQMEASIQQLHQKELADTQSNSYEQQKAASYAGETKASLLEERTHLQGELANLTSRHALVKRDSADVVGQINALHSKEHDSEIKIAEIAALPASVPIASPGDSSKDVH
jgi:chromosome segregation ATPase